MNCKPNDLALIVRGIDSGKVVTCLELAGPNQTIVDGPAAPEQYPIWRIDRALRWTGAFSQCAYAPYIPDAILMPIRPDADPMRQETVEELQQELEAQFQRVLSGYVGMMVR